MPGFLNVFFPVTLILPSEKQDYHPLPQGRTDGSSSLLPGFLAPSPASAALIKSSPRLHLFPGRIQEVLQCLALGPAEPVSYSAPHSGPTPATLTTMLPCPEHSAANSPARHPTVPCPPSLTSLRSHLVQQATPQDALPLALSIQLAPPPLIFLVFVIT